VAAKFVPRLLSQEQKEFLAEVAQDLLETAKKDADFPKKVIAGDKSWVPGYDPETKTHSSQTGVFIVKVLSTTSTLLQARQ